MSGFQFRKADDPPDPAEIAAESSAEVQRLLREARTAEREAEDYLHDENSEAAEALALNRASNLRLRALSIHLRAEGIHDGEQDPS